MTLAIALGLAWVTVGWVSMLYLSWEGCEVFTWFVLVSTFIFGGLCGPFIPGICGAIIFLRWMGDADFWNKPVFRCKERERNDRQVRG